MERELYSVIYKGKKYKVKKRGGLLTLDISYKKINDISEIEGLEGLMNLQSLNLANNQIKEIKNLETLKNLLKLDLRRNQISEINGLETLTNLEELNLDNNQIEVIKGFDNLEKLRGLNLFGNNISQVESIKNIENLHSLYLSGNPIYDKVNHMLGGSTSQKLVKYTQMSDEEINIAVRKSLEEKRITSELISKRIEKEDRRFKNFCCICECIIFVVIPIIFILIFAIGGI